MKNQSLVRLIAVTATSIALPLIVLTPAFLVLTFFTHPSANESESLPNVKVDESVDPKAIETVLVNSTIPHREFDADTGIEGWLHLEDSDVIKITIDDRGRDVRPIPADAPPTGQLVDPLYYTSDIIRNETAIAEDFVRHGDILTFSYAHDPSADKFPTDRDECSTILHLRVEDSDSRDSQTYIGYLKITGDASATAGRCVVPQIDADPQ